MTATGTIAIIGGGCSGTLCAVRVAQALPHAIIELYEREAPARGAAYSTELDAHLLNVPAGRMSAFDEDPDHFLRWLQSHASGARGTDFAPRRTFGAYLSSLLDASPRVKLIRADVQDIRPARSGVVVEASNQEGRPAERVVLALGNAAPTDPCTVDPALRGSRRYVPNPWTWNRTTASALASNASVLLIGTGLTMIDVLLSLNAMGHTGRIVACSRRGLLPQAHRAPHAPPSYAADLRHGTWPATARGYLRGIRDAIRASNDDWRETINRLRPITSALWQAMSTREQRRFLDRLRPYWDSHRHRMAPEIADTVNAAIARGRLRIVRGAVRALDSRDTQVEATVNGPHGQTALHADLVINCTGPALRVDRAHPLVAKLVGRGLVRLDALGLGIEATEDGVALDGDGRPSSQLLVLGPLLRGSRWESTAVPEIRNQAAVIAGVLARPQS